MRNLRLQGERHGAVDSFPNVAFVDRVRLVEGEAGRVFLTSGGRLVRVSEERCEIVWEVSLHEVVEESNAEGRWFSVTLVDTVLVCLSRSGAIATVDPLNGEASLVGEFQHGIYGGIWSPDREVLVLVTLAEPEDTTGSPSSVILCMTADFQVLAEIPMEPHETNETVYLVWRPDGSLLGVSSVDQTDQQRKIRIYQREPFKLLALGRTEDSSGKLIANIQSTPLAWAGPGCSQLMASIIPKGRKDLQIGFLEPNGLRHGQFQLRLSDATSSSVLGITWNAASDVLMVHVRESDYDTVQLWTRTNYHWYQKWNMQFPSRCSNASFDEEDPYQFDVLLESSAEWIQYKFRWETSNVDKFGTAIVVDGRELLLTPLEKALVPPPMAAATLSLPAPLLDIVVDETHMADKEPLLVAILSDGRAAIFAGEDSKSTSPVIPNFRPPSLKALAVLPEEAKSWRSWCFADNTTISESLESLHLVAVQAGSRYRQERLIDIVISWDTQETEPSEAKVDIGQEVVLENRLLAIVPWSDCAEGVLLELVDGTLLEYSPREAAVLPLEDFGTLLEPCPWIAGIKRPADLVQDSHRERFVVGMSERARLFCHDLLLSDSISSFILDYKHRFLCFATLESRCELRFLPLVGLIEYDPLSGLDETLPLLRGYEPRHVERGTTLVTALEKPSVILQMPRGNLEGIFPRALVLQHSMRTTNAGEFEHAFSLMRRQKVDVNLIVDMNPGAFVRDGAVELVEQVKNIDHLNLFISTLQNWDCTAVKYRIPAWLKRSLGRNPTGSDFDYSTKVNQVCERLRSILIEAERTGHTVGGRNVSAGQYLLPILSTFAKQQPPQLEQALSLIKSNALDTHGDSSRKPPLFSDSAQHSIQYLAFLADYELLFDTALGMYDFDIARAVARNSQMDPKFYLPLLKGYRELPQFYGRCQVDLRLKRFDMALRNLHESGKCGEEVSAGGRDEAGHSANGFEASFQLIKEHKLHGIGLELFRGAEEQHRILLDLGDNLLNLKKAEEALGIFLIADPVDRERVMKAARACRNWRIYFSHAFPQGIHTADGEADIARTEIEAPKRRMLARDVAEELESSWPEGSERRRALAEAAQLLLDYAEDVVEAIEVLLRGFWWEEAKRIATMHDRPDLQRRCVEAAVAYARISAEECREKERTFADVCKRYEEVLQIRKNAFVSGEVDALGLVVEGQEDDTGSVFSAASHASNLSNLSGGSTGSTGSVGSISTVISVRSTTSFSLAGADEAYRHKSKYNEIGKKGKKKKKKKAKTRTKVIPGSEQELQGLVESLSASIIDDDFVKLLADTILFLFHEREIAAARGLYAAATAASNRIRQCQDERKEREIVRVKESRKENHGRENVEHPSEITVDSLMCSEIATKVHELLRFTASLDLLS